MEKSNIFAYIELSKLVGELKTANTSEKLKENLKSQSAYFNIIHPKYFSDSLMNEWEGIIFMIKQRGIIVDEEGKATSNAMHIIIENLSYTECQMLANQIYGVFENLQKEFV